MIKPSNVPDDIRDISKNGCGINVVGKVLKYYYQLFSNVFQGNVAQLNVVNGIRQVIVEECIVQFVAFAPEVPEVICSDVRDAAGSNV